MTDQPVLEVVDLAMSFAARGGVGGLFGRPGPAVRALDGVSFSVGRGEVVALVGESGSGKTTTANLVVGLLEPTAGEVRLDGAVVAGRSRRELSAMRRQVQMIFQDPYESLDPAMRVEELVAEPIRVHRLATSGADERARVDAALDQAGLTPAALYRDRMPFELSGGQRQRVSIAAALAVDPAVLIADEPVSMLDVSIRAEILNLLRRLALERRMAILMITHDLATVAAYADRVAVMYLGRIVEEGPTALVLREPQHPYTRALLSVLPLPDPSLRSRRGKALSGEAPDPAHLPSGCRFHPRCPVAEDRCRTTDPALVQVGPGHEAACVLVGSGPVQRR